MWNRKQAPKHQQKMTPTATAEEWETGSLMQPGKLATFS